jgi:tryptophanyl-tRNA synthetase
MSKYNIKGFLPDSEPLARLPPYFAPWENLIDRLVELNENAMIREEIKNLPLLDITKIKSDEQARRAYVVLSMLSHSYIWSNGLANGLPILPKCLAVPFHTISQRLGLPAVMTHACVDLWNWRLKDKSRPIELENLETNGSLTGTQSESAFFLVMTEIEALGSEIISDLTRIPSLIAENDAKNINLVMSKFTIVIGKITNTLSKIYEGCKPEIFYNVLRKYLNGWGSGNIKDGLIFEGVSDVPVKYNGGSAAQSSLIQLFDIIFNVKHTSKMTEEFLNKMRFYMPKEHRDLLLELEKDMAVSQLDAYVLKSEDETLIKLYNECIKCLELFRSRHIGIVHAYVVKMMPKTNGNALGTGGTELHGFLNKCKEETTIKKLPSCVDEVKEEPSSEVVGCPVGESKEATSGCPVRESKEATSGCPVGESKEDTSGCVVGAPKDVTDGCPVGALKGTTSGCPVGELKDTNEKLNFTKLISSGTHSVCLNTMESEKKLKNLDPIDKDMDDSLVNECQSAKECASCSTVSDASVPKDKDDCIESGQTTTTHIVTPWVVEGDIDYMKLIKQFGTELIDTELMKKFERVTGHKLHPWIRRGIFFSHRALNQLLDAYENGEPVFLYTGRGPTSDSMHLGHLIPFMFTKWLQDVFKCPLVIQMADDEKYYFKKLEFADVYRLGFENAKDIIACGFDMEKTFIFSNRDYRMNVHAFEEFVSTMKKQISGKQVAKIFGFGDRVEVKNDKGEMEERYVFDENVTVGMMDWPFYQSAAAFSQAFPHIFNGRPAHCLVAYAIDQDPYFRMARDLAGKMNLLKPYSIMCTFIPPLTGSAGKMSSSVGADATLFLTDKSEVLREKIMKHAFSGGGGDGSMADHKKYGGNPDVDISYQYLRYFEFDDDKLAEIKDGFKNGEISCSQMKTMMADKIVNLFMDHQHKRTLVTKEILDNFYKLKPIELPEQKRELTKDEAKLYEVLDELKVKHQTLYHQPITTMEQGQEIAKKLSGKVCKNLLLQGKDMYYLYVTDMTTVVNMKTLHKKLGITKIKFAEKHMLQELLHVPIGCATVFGLLNDKEHRVTVVFDDSLPKDQPVNFHPLRNDATTTISYVDMLKFLNHLGYTPTYVTVGDTATTTASTTC